MSCTCNSLKAISTTCGESSVGGIKRVIVACANDVTITPKTGDGNEGLADVTIESGKKTYQISFRKQSSSFSSEYTLDDVNGVKFVTTTAEIVVAKMNLARRNAIEGLLDSEVVAFVEDMNGNYWVMGAENVVTATACTFTSGTAASDANNFTITLTDISSRLPYALDSTGISNITAEGTLEQ